MGDQGIGGALDPKHNSLNFLRLVLALGVVYSHACEIGAFPNRNVVINDTSLGTISVYGFFGISGYLIAGSATRNGFGRYLWQRCLRILPAFWVCLAVTAFVFGSVVWWRYPLPHCHLGCYLRLDPGPASFVYSNLWLKMNQMTVGHYWVSHLVGDGSLWTLFYEFLCYLFLGGLAVAGLLRRRYWVLGITLMLFVTLATVTVDPALNQHFTLGNNGIVMEFLILSVIFMTGALIFQFREVIPDSALLAAASAVGFAASLFLPTGGHVPTFRLTDSCLGAFLIVYPLLWLGAHLPCRRIGSRNDYSYGVYIYAYPLTQLTVLFHGRTLGFVPFLLVVVGLTAVFAASSWWLVERPALRLKKATWPPRWSVPRAKAPTVAADLPALDLEPTTPAET